jgi:purine-binding chemotaxis protein CheW
MTYALKNLAFAVHEQRFGFDILRVQEIMSVPRITRVPNAPAYVKGVINLRGRIIPVIDIRARFQLMPKDYDDKTCIIVVHAKRKEERFSVGVIVDTVLEVIDFSAEEIEIPPDFGDPQLGDMVLGIGKKSDQVLNILLDVEKVVNSNELQAVSEMTPVA